MDDSVYYQKQKAVREASYIELPKDGSYSKMLKQMLGMTPMLPQAQAIELFFYSPTDPVLSMRKYYMELWLNQDSLLHRIQLQEARGSRPKTVEEIGEHMSQMMVYQIVSAGFVQLRGAKAGELLSAMIGKWVMQGRPDEPTFYMTGDLLEIANILTNFPSGWALRRHFATWYVHDGEKPLDYSLSLSALESLRKVFRYIKGEGSQSSDPLINRNVGIFSTMHDELVAKHPSSSASDQPVPAGDQPQPSAPASQPDSAGPPAEPLGSGVDS